MLNIAVPSHLKVLSPQQVVVKEPTSSTSYKRLVLPILVCGSVEFKVDESSVSVDAQSTKFCEMVLELHEDLMSPGSIDAMKEQPLACFKKALAMSKTSMSELSVYSYRVIKSFDNKRVHQAIIKVPHDVMVSLLKFSGTTELFVRQFLQPDEVTCHSVLPRYWQPCGEDLRAALQLGQALGDPFRGLALTNKGIAIRADNAHLAAARKLVLADDVRFTDLNRGTIIRKTYIAQGYPFQMSHASLIETTHAAVKIAPIPLRSYRVGGLHTWVLAFDREPATLEFTIKMDSVLHEVILTLQVPSQTKPKKPSSKTKAGPREHGVKPVHLPGSTQLNIPGEEAKMHALESRVSRLEVQQTELSQKVDTRFDQVSLQLQQVLAAVQPSQPQNHGRPRNAEVTGDTPPPKAARGS